MSSLLLMLALAAAPVDGSAACPPPAMGMPRYPADQLRGNVAGTTLVLARIDDCGRVVEAKLSESSGDKSLDAEALLTVREWVLSPAQREQVGGGPWVKMPVKFGGVQTVVTEAPKWPRSHRRPVYLLDDQGIGFDTIAAYQTAGVVRSKPVLKSPYGSTRDGSGNWISTPFMADAKDPNVFWLAYNVQPPHTPGPNGKPRASLSASVAIARYRLVMEGGKPVVRVAIVCERPVDECDRLTAFLLKGLPIARPPR
ncbi:MAG: energy transducer TonB [Arenimonas sp.]|nr:energy transducer TonB [Arenimonas sp.]